MATFLISNVTKRNARSNTHRITSTANKARNKQKSHTTQSRPMLSKLDRAIYVLCIGRIRAAIFYAAFGGKIKI